MENERAYLNADLNIEIIARDIKESKHNVSRVLNEKLNLNFFRFVNGYRIEYAKKPLVNPKMNHFTIAAIAFECGFSSVSSFNIVFKKFENVTPSEFKRQNQKKGSVA